LKPDQITIIIVAVVLIQLLVDIIVVPRCTPPVVFLSRKAQVDQAFVGEWLALEDTVDLCKKLVNTTKLISSNILKRVQCHQHCVHTSIQSVFVTIQV